MARLRRSDATSKRTDRAIADVALGPRAELPLAPDLADEIEMTWAALGPVGHQRFAAGYPDHASMVADTQRLIRRVRKRATRRDFRTRLLQAMAATDASIDFAEKFVADLAALVRRDPRYLASDLIVGLMLMWKFMVIRGMQLARASASAKRSIVAERARKYLGDLADAASALAVVTGRGRHEFIDPIVLLADHERHLDVVRAVLTMAKDGKTDDEIGKEIEKENEIEISGKPIRLAGTERESTKAKKGSRPVSRKVRRFMGTTLSSATIAAIRGRPRAVKQHAEQLTMDLYRPTFQVDELRRLLSAARTALDPLPAGWEREGGARRVKSRPPAQ